MSKFDLNGKVHMVDVSEKNETFRTARAHARTRNTTLAFNTGTQEIIEPRREKIGFKMSEWLAIFLR